MNLKFRPKREKQLFRLKFPRRSMQRNNFQGITNDDVIYLIMPDRFADGDQANNKDVDRQNPRMWHGGDFKGITKNIPYLKELGITAIWLTPWYDNPDEPNNCDKPWCPNTNYHGYHAIDYYGVENHFGTMEDFLEMIREGTSQRNQSYSRSSCQSRRRSDIRGQKIRRWKIGLANTRRTHLIIRFCFRRTLLRLRKIIYLNGWFNEFLPDMNQDEPEVAKYRNSKRALVDRRNGH